MVGVARHGGPRWRPGPFGGAPWLTSIRLWIVVAAVLLCLGCLAGAAGVWVEQRGEAPAQVALRNDLRPAQIAAEQLVKAYDDEQTGLRSYLLTGDRAALSPYRTGAATARARLVELERALAGRPQAMERLAAIRTQGARWRAETVAPQLAARARGPLTQAQIDRIFRRGTSSFDTLRARLASLSVEVNRLIAAELNRFDNAQHAARLLQRAALGLVVVGAGLMGFVLWWTTSRPLHRLVDSVDAVAAGAHDSPVVQGGPQEYARIARAVERMRQSLLLRSEELADAQREVTVFGERERVAEALHARVAQRVFALGLRLTSMASAPRPPAARELHELVAETDEIIAQLRGVAFPREDRRDDGSQKASPPDS